MTTYLPFLCVFLPTLLYGAYLLIQAEGRRKAAIAQRKAKRAHDDSVRKDYGYYNRASFVSHTKTTYLHPYECLNDDTRPILTIEAENADAPLSDVWVNAIEGLEIGE